MFFPPLRPIIIICVESREPRGHNFECDPTSRYEWRYLGRTRCAYDVRVRTEPKPAVGAAADEVLNFQPPHPRLHARRAPARRSRK